MLKFIMGIMLVQEFRDVRSIYMTIILYIEYIFKKWAYNLAGLFCHPFLNKGQACAFSILKGVVRFEESF